jgi:glycosyltransferase involved in cell wall biosynthesis
MSATADRPETYLMVLPVPGYPLPDGKFAIESAFAEHLRQLRAGLGALGEHMVVASPSMSDATYAEQKSHLGVLDEKVDQISYRALFPLDTGRLQYMLHVPRVFRALFDEISRARVVHSGNSILYRPFEFPALLMARALNKKTISVADIDARRSAFMNYKTGRWSLKEYVVTRVLHDSFAHVQTLVGVRAFSLVLLKGAKMASDYGAGRPNVKNFLDTAFSAGHIVPDAVLEQKLRALQDPATPIDLCFFGRLVGYKGIDHMLHAFAKALKSGVGNVRLHVVGGGPDMTKLVALAKELELGDRAIFHGPVPFGPELFQRLYGYHVLLAAPLSEDTPRSAVDAMASGQALVAYDTYYYRELGDAGAPVAVVPWLDIDAFARKLVEVTTDRPRLAKMARAGVEFARNNTQEQWLARRIEWTRALFEDGAANA